MGKRREGRELAVQFLYQWEAAPKGTIQVEQEEFWGMTGASKSARAFATDLINGILPHLKELDKHVDRYVKN